MNSKFYKKISFCLVLLFILSLIFLHSSFAEDNVPEMYSPSALLMDYNTGKILYEKNINEKMYPASLTKVLTAIVVLENSSLDDKATVSYDAVMSIPYGYVTANLQVDEELTVEELLYVLMVGSSNDAAIVLAEHIAGSVESFSEMMNEKAKEIGCTNTHFVNPNGEHDENHYTTAYDLALMAKYAMQNETFRKIVSTTSYKLPATNKYDKDDRLFTTTNSLLMINNNDRADNYYYKYAIGIKTGFTTPAGNCLIAAAKKDDLELISVVLGAGQTDDGLSARYIDTISLFDYGYNTYSLREIAKAGSTIQTANIKGATRNTKKLDVIAKNDIYVLSKNENKNLAILPEVHLSENLKAPINQGDKVGTVKYTSEGIEYTEDLLASSDVKKSHFLIKFLLFVLLVFICLLYLDYRKRMIKRKRMAHRKRLNR